MRGADQWVVGQLSCKDQLTIFADSSNSIQENGGGTIESFVEWGGTCHMLACFQLGTQKAVRVGMNLCNRTENDPTHVRSA